MSADEKEKGPNPIDSLNSLRLIVDKLDVTLDDDVSPSSGE